MQIVHSCPTLLISAPASNQGKTMVTAALARFHSNNGLRVKVFKVGPDYLDPMILERASRQKVDHLDLWMVGVDGCRTQLFNAAANFDLILIEGVMGLFDGNPCTADVAELSNIPVAVVIDASGMAETIAAVASGMAHFRPGLNYYGAIANRVASDKHATIIEKSTTNLLGSIRRSDSFVLPSRHLGLVQAAEVDNLEFKLDSAAAEMTGTRLVEMPPLTTFSNCQLPSVDSFDSSQSMPLAEPLLKGKKIAIAKDNAFSFLYQANLDLMEAMGATLSFFSPLEDQTFEPSDCVYLPGGYPELFLDLLSGNKKTIGALTNHVSSGGKIYAECGGMLFLLNSLIDVTGNEYKMAGLIPAEAKMNKRLSALGHQYLSTDSGELRGHTFHYSELTTALPAFTHARAKYGGKQGEAMFRHGNINASYVHFYFPSNPKIAASLLLGV